MRRPVVTAVTASGSRATCPFSQVAGLPAGGSGEGPGARQMLPSPSRTAPALRTSASGNVARPASVELDDSPMHMSADDSPFRAQARPRSAATPELASTADSASSAAVERGTDTGAASTSLDITHDDSSPGQMEAVAAAGETLLG